MIKKILVFFDKLEDKVRGRLSHFPIIYALIGGVGIVLFWRGVWHTVDYIMAFWNIESSSMSLEGAVWWDGPLSLILGSTILLMTGVFVSNFIGNEIIITGLKGEKRVAEKTEIEVKTEVGEIGEIKTELKEISKKIEKLEKENKDSVK